jgi:hypothetical protein
MSYDALVRNGQAGKNETGTAEAPSLTKKVVPWPGKCYRYMIIEKSSQKVLTMVHGILELRPISNDLTVSAR